ncbi:MAG: bifunctional alpha,alpha-trehalose-phosphate synthase (UDP-forming)/trehalose-phosphatase [Candidatus Saccharimonadales bacterium]
MGKRVIVSNRLPVTVKKIDGKLSYTQSNGGLATALSSFTSKRNSLWIGWPGLAEEDVTEQEKRDITRELKKRNCHPIFLTRKQLDRFYNGYSNGVLWPLFHDMEISHGDTEQNWKEYVSVNRLYADTTLSLSTTKDTIWVHDYQLMLVPERIRISRPKGKIGFFLHIPFPAIKHLFKTSYANKLLRGTLGADVVGMHTPSYVKHFLACCTQAKIGRVGTEKVLLPDRAVKVTDFPISIDYDAFSKATNTLEVAKEYRRLQWKYRGMKVILISDRMDPTKGLVERLRAYQTLLRTHKELRGKVILAMIAMPSRGEIEVYKKLREDIEKLVVDINKEFGTKAWQPIDARFDSFPFAQYAALYRRADVAFIAPIRDGMNLVAKEFIASATKHDGVLVLSETAGAAEELKDAILVNPKRPKSLVDGLQKALTLPKSELRRRTANMERHIKHFDVDRWVDSFITTLEKPVAIPSTPRTKTLNPKVISRMKKEFKAADKRLLLLDYDGTLVPFAKHPGDAKPSKELLAFIKQLTKDPRNDVVIVSGRDKDYLQTWFGSLHMGLAAEHGALFRRKGGKNWHKTSSAPLDWQPDVLGLFNYYSDLTPGAFTEKKSWALVWHYRNASPFYAQKHLVALKRLTKPIVKEYNLTFKEGNKVVEILPTEINKGRIAQEWLIKDHDFVLCIGDDTTDEDMFKSVPPNTWSIKVGRGITSAGYRVPSQLVVLDTLKKLT